MKKIIILILTVLLVLDGCISTPKQTDHKDGLNVTEEDKKIDNEEQTKIRAKYGALKTAYFDLYENITTQKSELLAKMDKENTSCVDDYFKDMDSELFNLNKSVDEITQKVNESLNLFNENKEILKLYKSDIEEYVKEDKEIKQTRDEIANRLEKEKETCKEKNKRYIVGDSTTNGKKIFTLNNIETTRKIDEKDNKYLVAEAPSGKIYVLVDITVENVGTESTYLNPYDLDVLDQDGNIYTRDIDGLTALETYFQGGDTPPGIKRSGGNPYLIPDNTKALILIYNFGSEQKVYEVPLDMSTIESELKEKESTSLAEIMPPRDVFKDLLGSGFYDKDSWGDYRCTYKLTSEEEDNLVLQISDGKSYNPNDPYPCDVKTVQLELGKSNNKEVSKNAYETVLDDLKSDYDKISMETIGSESEATFGQSGFSCDYGILSRKDNYLILLRTKQTVNSKFKCDYNKEIMDDMKDIVRSIVENIKT